MYTINPIFVLIQTYSNYPKGKVILGAFKTPRLAEKFIKQVNDEDISFMYMGDVKTEVQGIDSKYTLYRVTMYEAD